MIGPVDFGSAVSDDEFALFQRLIHHESGIFLQPSKRALLQGRLTRRLRELELATYGAYYRRVSEDPVEKVRMLDCICTNETRFFREPRHFEFVREEVLPALRRRDVRRLRAWSAGCATGEEPYSLAMLLCDELGLDASVRILASDLSTRALAHAEAAVWPIERMTEIPERYRKRYMLRGTRSQAGRMKAGPELRDRVTFLRLNLNDWIYNLQGTFELIFCRNVLIYFDAAAKARVVEQLLAHLQPGGFLLVGHAESLTGLSDGLQPIEPTIYRRCEASR
jgi:chemotaxis protein methyltransferase CheR